MVVVVMKAFVRGVKVVVKLVVVVVMVLLLVVLEGGKRPPASSPAPPHSKQKTMTFHVIPMVALVGL